MSVRPMTHDNKTGRTVPIPRGPNFPKPSTCASPVEGSATQRRKAGRKAHKAPKPPREPNINTSKSGAKHGLNAYWLGDSKLGKAKGDK